MRLDAPKYIPRSLLGNPTIRYRWDDSDFSWVYGDFDSEIPPLIERLAEPALCAFSVAISEWVFFRLAPLEPGSNAMLFLEAAWCANIDRRYCDMLEVDRNGPMGPVKGPILVAENIVNSALYESMESLARPILEPAELINLVAHIYGPTPEFQAWWMRCINVLSRLYLAPNLYDDLYDDVANSVKVPREAFDLDYPFVPEKTSVLLDSFLREIDHMANPFLRSPQEMIEEGFEGTPYTYPTRMANES